LKLIVTPPNYATFFRNKSCLIFISPFGIEGKIRFTGFNQPSYLYTHFTKGGVILQIQIVSNSVKYPKCGSETYRWGHAANHRSPQRYRCKILIAGISLSPVHKNVLKNARLLNVKHGTIFLG
jgi:hypothetical protein